MIVLIVRFVAEINCLIHELQFLVGRISTKDFEMK